MKKIYFLVLAFCFFNGLSAQVINFPDAKFKAKLLNADVTNNIAKDANGISIKIDANNNGEVEVNEINGVIKLKIDNSQLTSLVGIQNFNNLQFLNCDKNSLANLDLTGLNKLKSLECNENKLTSITLTGVNSLEILSCETNSLTSVNVSSLLLLKNLSIRSNKISALNILSLSNLENLNCSNNQITDLNTSGLLKLKDLSIYTNPLKNLNTSKCVSLIKLYASDFELNDLNISDCTYLIELDIRYGSVQNLNAENCINLNNINNFFSSRLVVEKLNLTGCASMTTIKFNNNDDYIANLNLTNCTNLINLECNKIRLAKLDLTGCNKLTSLFCNTNELSVLDVSKCINLDQLEISFNKLTDLNVTGCTRIKSIKCNSNALVSLNLSGLSELLALNCEFNKLTSINTTGLLKIQKFNCSNNKLTDISVKALTKLQDFDCNYNLLINLDVSNLSNLKTFNFHENPTLISLNASNCVLIENMVLAIPIEDVNLSGCNGLKSFLIKSLSYEGVPYRDVKNLNLSNCSNLLSVEVNSKNIANLNISNCSKLTNLTYQFGILDNMDISNDIGLKYIYLREFKYTKNLVLKELLNLETIVFDWSEISNVDISELPNLVSVTGTSYLINTINASKCKKLNVFSVDAKYINLSECEILPLISYDNNNNLVSLNASKCSGLEFLTIGNENFDSLNVEGCSALKEITITSSGLINLDLSNLLNLELLYVLDNEKLTSLNLLNLSKLKTAEISRNSIGSLDVSSIANLELLNCDNNLLTDLNVKSLVNLNRLDCSVNKLSKLDLSTNKNITSVSCAVNQLSSLDLNELANLHVLDCANNQLNYLFVNGIKKDINFDYNFSKNPDLQYICVDENRIKEIQDGINKLGYTNCEINSYCSFTPGGVFYTIIGNNRFDSDNNGCDLSDIQVSNLKLKIENESKSGVLISDASGKYSIPVQEGSYGITPVLENPSYFIVSTPTVRISFPLQASPVIQDFCISPNGVHNDLEITILPIESARPGFNSSYKVIYKNKGNMMLSGAINLTFKDAVLDFISANPVVNTQKVNNLSWNFTNLKPFESKEITFTIKVNAPTATPAVNNGDVLVYTANITSTATDETPKDNTFTLNQIVVGSFDPNDKTCLEGTIVTPTLIGEYVHYLIRFENKGTYAAQNIVVKDMIDLSKFDISTLVPTDASHSYITKISDGNKVEFIFEKINLPFDDANNDGYIAFKIKTKSTLRVGDSFDNEANIYFDYNFPVLTNKATSKFATTLGTQDFEFSNYFKVYPIPADEVLNISAIQNIEIKSIAVYDILGQMVIALPNLKDISKIDVSNLRTGNYFLKIKSDKGSSSMKFIKN
jgi:Leucine-rich repeat (LRR) protein